MWNIKGLALTVQKLLRRLKFQRGGPNDRMTELQNDRQDKNNMPPDLRSRGHKNIRDVDSRNIFQHWTSFTIICNSILFALCWKPKSFRDIVFVVSSENPLSHQCQKCALVSRTVFQVFDYQLYLYEHWLFMTQQCLFCYIFKNILQNLFLQFYNIYTVTLFCLIDLIKLCPNICTTLKDSICNNHLS